MYRKSVWNRHQNDVLFPKYRLFIQNTDVHKTMTKGLIEQKKSWIRQKSANKVKQLSHFYFHRHVKSHSISYNILHLPLSLDFYYSSIISTLATQNEVFVLCPCIQNYVSVF